VSDLDDVDEMSDEFDEESGSVDDNEILSKPDLKELQQRKLEMRRKVEERIELRRLREELGDPDFDYV